MRYEILQADKIPLDLISFVELELRMDLIPYDLLRRTSERMRQSSRTFPAFTSMARSSTGCFPPWMPSMEGTLGWPTPRSAAKRRS